MINYGMEEIGVQKRENVGEEKWNFLINRMYMENLSVKNRSKHITAHIIIMSSTILQIFVLYRYCKNYLAINSFVRKESECVLILNLYILF